MKNNTISFFRNQLGIAMLEATVAAGILGIVSVGMMMAMDNMNKIKDHSEGVKANQPFWEVPLPKAQPYRDLSHSQDP